MSSFTVSGHIVDLVQNRIFPGTVQVEKGKIASITEGPPADSQYILPGFIDSHIHIESSMLVPSEFARLAVVHGTVATVSDPHEIGNVLGVDGVRYMIHNSKKVPFHFYFGASPCVPATSFETAGARITPEDIRALFEEDGLKYLSEMMNFPGVLHKDPDVMEKISIAKSLGRPIDGHAPGLMGEQAREYIMAGISTDHECIELEEALDKINYGMKILIREGSAAKNYEALRPLIKLHPRQVMFCNDDKHPNELVKGHIDELVRRSVSLGYELMDVLRCACLHPILHYHLDVGKLQKGDPADFIIVDNLRDFKVKATYIQGRLVAKDGKTLIDRVPVETINHFHCSPKSASDFAVKASGKQIQVIQAIPGELVTGSLALPAAISHGQYVTDTSRDILKLVVVNRYEAAPPAIAFIKGFGLKQGALASCIAHDSHNIIAVGVDDESLCKAVNAVIESKGGIAVVENGKAAALPLPVAGLMSADEGYQVAKSYESINKRALGLGTSMPDPFMTLSFMALLVIPSLKLSDRGLFDGKAFKFTPLSIFE